MIAVAKPPLDEVYLAHFGKKGMKWGVRKKRPDEEQRKKFFTKQRAIKVGVATAMLAGTAATIYLLNKRGEVKAADLMSERAIQRYNPRGPRQGPIAKQIADGRRRYEEARVQTGGKKLSEIMMTPEQARQRLEDPDHVWEL